MVEVKAPGKLMVSGEYSVLEGAPCVAAAVDKYVYCSVKPWKGLRFRSKSLGLDWVEAEFNKALIWKRRLSAREKEKLAFAGKALEVVLRYLQDSGKEADGMAVETWSEETRAGGKKVGFGSSAAVTVAVIGGVLKAHDYNLMDEYAKEIVFKLACLAHYEAQGKVGSAYDIACSTYGRLIYFTRCDAKWLERELASGKDVRALVEQKWKGFTQRWLLPPPGFTLLCAFTGKSASTTALVKKVLEFEAKDPAGYDRSMNALRASTEKLVHALDADDEKGILAAVKENRRGLQALGAASGAKIETPELRTLADAADDAGAAGKLSGAGGGDSGIAVCFDAATARRVTSEWRKRGLKPLQITVAEQGVD